VKPTFCGKNEKRIIHDLLNKITIEESKDNVSLFVCLLLNGTSALFMLLVPR